MNIDKKYILDELITFVTKDLDKSSEALQSSKDLINHPDMKQEAKYDTRKIEASYLAGAQDLRVRQLKNDLALLKKLRETLEAKSSVVPGAIVKYSFLGKEKIAFFSAASGGHKVNYSGIYIEMISTVSPLGQEMIDLEVGDFFEFELPSGEEVECEILAIL